MHFKIARLYNMHSDQCTWSSLLPGIETWDPVFHFCWHRGTVKYGPPHWNNLEQWPTSSSEEITRISYSDVQGSIRVFFDKFPRGITMCLSSKQGCRIMKIIWHHHRCDYTSGVQQCTQSLFSRNNLHYTQEEIWRQLIFNLKTGGWHAIPVAFVQVCY